VKPWKRVVHAIIGLVLIGRTLAVLVALDHGNWNGSRQDGAIMLLAIAVWILLDRKKDVE